MHLQPVPVGLEPSPNVGILMVRGVVLNQNRPLPTVSPGELLEEDQIAGGVEDRILPVVEARAPEFNGAEDLHGFALSGDGNFRRATHATPGGVQGGVLAKAGFIGKDQCPVSRLGFFLRAGYVRRCQRSWAVASARANTRRGRCTENPQACISLPTWPG